MTAAMKPWDAADTNFSDESRTSCVAFPPATVERLRAAKAKYDPENLFHANHPVVSDPLTRARDRSAPHAVTHSTAGAPDGVRSPVDMQDFAGRPRGSGR